MLPCSRMVSTLQNTIRQNKIKFKIIPKNCQKRNSSMNCNEKRLDRNYCLLPVWRHTEPECYKRNGRCKLLFVAGVMVSLHWLRPSPTPRARSKRLVWGCAEVFTLNKPHWQQNFMELISVSELDSMNLNEPLHLLSSCDVTLAMTCKRQLLITDKPLITKWKYWNA